MDLKQHKDMVWQYEQILEELRALKAAAKARETDWCATYEASLDSGQYLLEIPLPAEYAAKLLQERTWLVEREAKEMADRLGVTFDEQA